MLHITFSNERQTETREVRGGQVFVGRDPRPAEARIVVDDRFVSRDQLCLELIEPGVLQVECLGAPVLLDEETTIERGEVKRLPLPVRLTAGFTMFEITHPLPSSPLAANGALQTISRPVYGPPVYGDPIDGDQDWSKHPLRNRAPLGETPSPTELAEWFETLLRVQRSAAGSRGFYEETARAVVDLVRLDRGLVLLRKGQEWEVAAEYSDSPGQGPKYSRTILDQVIAEKRTFFRGLQQQEQMHSLVGIDTVVASPVFDAKGEVSGVVYGVRQLGAAAECCGIRPLEAQLVQLLAAAVSAGWARLETEAEAARTRVQFESVFSPELVQELERNPDMLAGHDCEVSVLFSDVRSFSRISERLGARSTYELLSDVMDTLTDCIMDEGGVMIDYHGDGLAAMWNAPRPDADHADRACRAAVAMLETLPDLSRRWHDRIGFPLAVGIGINTGQAQVGNAGSQRRMKYGPLGPTVNLASRTEGATKFFQVPLLVTGAVVDQLSDRRRTRRLATVRVVGIDAPVPLYEYWTGELSDHWLARREAYQTALELLEQHQAEMAQEVVMLALQDTRSTSDLPLRQLNQRIASVLANAADTYETVVQLASK